ncbi:hypothetical protein HK44_008930 [Pseudomonas fluorescens HK44]|uniref:Uncharacterized protein n=1 Tax=Pseudomonas fluorescens HK44 TaxID=1042209 RepID=A0A010TA02_PSEFL|nr:hypothetical protein HK44_008930 [Pseudomonas fluorescens HK44]
MKRQKVAFETGYLTFLKGLMRISLFYLFAFHLSDLLTKSRHANFMFKRSTTEIAMFYNLYEIAKLPQLQTMLLPNKSSF